MTTLILEPRTEPRRPAHSPPWPALTAARPAPQALSPEHCEPAAHASSPAWAAPLFDAIAAAEPAARIAHTLCVLVRWALDQPPEARRLAHSFAASDIARRIRGGVAEGWALGRFSTRDLEAAQLAVLGVAEIALQRALDCGPDDPATPLITRELTFGLLRALGLPDSVASTLARDAALEFLIRSH